MVDATNLRNSISTVLQANYKSSANGLYTTSFKFVTEMVTSLQSKLKEAKVSDVYANAFLMAVRGFVGGDLAPIKVCLKETPANTVTKLISELQVITLADNHRQQISSFITNFITRNFVDNCGLSMANLIVILKAQLKDIFYTAGITENVFEGFFSIITDLIAKGKANQPVCLKSKEVVINNVINDLSLSGIDSGDLSTITNTLLPQLIDTYFKTQSSGICVQSIQVVIELFADQVTNFLASIDYDKTLSKIFKNAMKVQINNPDNIPWICVASKDKIKTNISSQLSGFDSNVQTVITNLVNNYVDVKFVATNNQFCANNMQESIPILIYSIQQKLSAMGLSISVGEMEMLTNIFTLVIAGVEINNPRVCIAPDGSELKDLEKTLTDAGVDSTIISAVSDAIKSFTQSKFLVSH